MTSEVPPVEGSQSQLSVGDAIEMYVIASNDGWEWVPATVLDVHPLRVRWWDGEEKAWTRPGARIPQIRSEREAREETPRLAPQDTVERLRAENEQLREALTDIRDAVRIGAVMSRSAEYAERRAVEALGGSQVKGSE